MRIFSLIRRGIVLLVLVTVPLGAGPVPAPQEEAEAPPAPPEEPAPLVIPEADRNRANPVRRTPESIRHGRELFATQCTMCHGPRGDGKGDLVERLQIEVPDFTDTGTRKARTDGELFYILTHGHGDMPGEADRLPDEWKWDLIHYLRTFREGGS